MLHFEAGTRSGEDPEDLHKMRVATRRMRAAWRDAALAAVAGPRSQAIGRPLLDALPWLRDDPK